RFTPLPGQWQCSQEDADAAEEVFARWLQRYTRAEIRQMARENDLLVFPVLETYENLESEQLKARRYFQQIEHPEIGTSVTYPGPPVRLSTTPWRIKSRAPLLGEHNAAVYEALGLKRDDLETLRVAGAI
ncbi:MAG: CoA transferase, partial [Dehalococcoidia bacterium]|nr:CoA transferase [Dehalococcoidia bacterium]